MDADERDICIYLKGLPGQFISGREIARRAAGKKRFREQSDWATPVLSRLVEKGIIDSDATGHYRLKPVEKKPKNYRYLSPQVKKILQASGKNFEGVFEIEETDEDLFADR